MTRGPIGLRTHALMEPFAAILLIAAVRRDIREQLQSQHMTEIMSAVTKLSNELKGDSKIASFPENLH